MRPQIAERLAKAGLDDIVHAFDPEKFNPVSPLGLNLLYAIPTRFLTQETPSKEVGFLEMLDASGLVDELAQMSVGVIEGLTATFGTDGTDHPLFRRFNMSDDIYPRLAGIMPKRGEVGEAALPPRCPATERKRLTPRTCVLRAWRGCIGLNRKNWHYYFRGQIWTSHR